MTALRRELEELTRDLHSRGLRIETLLTQHAVLRFRAEKAERELERRSDELEEVQRRYESLRIGIEQRTGRTRELENALSQQADALLERESAIADLMAKLRAQSTTFAARDELTRIPGIGPKYASKLIALGITSYQQIADWSDSHMERIAKDLGTRATRIQRAGWRESAAALLQERGEPPARTATSDPGSSPASRGP